MKNSHPDPPRPAWIRALALPIEYQIEYMKTNVYFVPEKVPRKEERVPFLRPEIPPVKSACVLAFRVRR